MSCLEIVLVCMCGYWALMKKVIKNKYAIDIIKYIMCTHKQMNPNYELNCPNVMLY